MKTLRAMLVRVAGLFRRKQDEAEMNEELRAHLDALTERNVAAGMSPEEARFAALREFGGVEQIKEHARDERRSVWADHLARDVRYAVRQLRKTPGFTIVGLLTLALGIGASAAVFSIVHAVVLRPLAFPAAERLVAVRAVVPAFTTISPTFPVNARFFSEWRACPAFSELAVIDRIRTTLTGAGEAVRVPTAHVSANLFATLRVAPALGRAFSPDEDVLKKSSVVILSDRLWRNRFSADPAILGRPIVLDQRPCTIVGVLPPGFRLPEAREFSTGRIDSSAEPEIFLPKEFGQSELADIVGRFNYEVIGRLAPGISPAEAVAQMNVVAARLVSLSARGHEVRGVLAPLHEAMVGPARRGLFLLLGAICAVLLIAGLNLSMLALARAERRGHEFAVRAALGASRGRLLRQAFVESLMLALAGGGLGVCFASWGLDLLLTLAPADLPRLDEVRLDSTVLLFALGLTIAMALFAGLVPAWRAARADAREALPAGAGRTMTSGKAARRLRQVLIAVEVGVSTLLLATAALFATSFIRLVRVDPGFHAPGTLSTELAIPSAKYRTDAERIAYRQRLLAAVTARPGVTSAAITTALPLQGETWIDVVWTPGDSRPLAERAKTNVRLVSADFFATLGIPLAAGRTFRDSDREHKPALVSAQLAVRLWPGADPLGRKIDRGNGELFEVIGVVGDVRASADQRAPLMLYLPHWAWTGGSFTVIAKISGDPGAIAPTLRTAIRGLDADVPVGVFRSMDDILQTSLAPRRFQLRLVAAFALSALMLAALGIYGVVSHSAAQRTRELGIRLAFGANPAALRRLVLRQGFAPVAWGLIGGIAGAFAGGRLIASLLFETSARDPLTLGAGAAALVLVALLAAWIPARRATRIDPMIALRTE
jgi:predicted permease